MGKIIVISDALTLENGKYHFQVIDGGLECQRYNEYWRDFAGDNAVYTLFSYALAVQGQLANLLCDCDYLLPSENANNPTLHGENCPFRKKIEELKNE